MDKIYLSRRNLLCLLSKLDRKLMGENTYCTIVKRDNKHPLYSQTMDACAVIAVEDTDYYTDRLPGEMLDKDIK